MAEKAFRIVLRRGKAISKISQAGLLMQTEVYDSSVQVMSSELWRAQKQLKLTKKFILNAVVLPQSSKPIFSQFVTDACLTFLDFSVKLFIKY